MKEPDSGQPLPAAEFQILLTLLEGPRHGHGIKNEVGARTSGQVVLGPGTLYTAIKRMLHRGLVEETAAGVPQADERRRYYRITNLGRTAAEAEALRMKSLVELAAAQRLIPGFRGTE